MPSTKNLEHWHFVKGLDPVANAFASTVYSDVVSMATYEKCMFVIYVGVGASGTSTLTVEACDDFTPSNTSAIVFHYREVTSGDTEGAMTKATTSGFLTTAGSSRIVIVEVSQEDLAASGYKNVRLKAVEGTASAVLGSILVIQTHPRYAKSAKPTTIA